jgi:hypothetical protein
MLWPANVTVVLHDTIETKGLSKEDVPALREKVREIISLPLEVRLKMQDKQSEEQVDAAN